MNLNSRGFRLGLLSFILSLACGSFLYLRGAQLIDHSPESHSTSAGGSSLSESGESNLTSQVNGDMGFAGKPTASTSIDINGARSVLPKLSTPLSAQLPLLVEEASRGNPTASCRLALSRVRCTTELARREFASRMRKGLETGKNQNEDYWIDSVATAEEYFSRLDGFCEGVDAKTLPSIDDALRYSYANLSPRQKTILAMLRSDGQVRRLLNPTGYSEMGTYLVSQTLAERSYDFLLDGFRAKDPLALEGLIMVHAPGAAIPPQGVSLRMPNPKLFLRYTLLYVDLYGIEAIGKPAQRLASTALSTLTTSERQALREQVDSDMEDWRLNFTSRLSLPPLSNHDEVTSSKQLEICED